MRIQLLTCQFFYPFLCGSVGWLFTRVVGWFSCHYAVFMSEFRGLECKQIRLKEHIWIHFVKHIKMINKVTQSDIFQAKIVAQQSAVHPCCIRWLLKAKYQYRIREMSLIWKKHFGLFLMNSWISYQACSVIYIRDVINTVKMETSSFHVTAGLKITNTPCQQSFTAPLTRDISAIFDKLEAINSAARNKINKSLLT